LNSHLRVFPEAVDFRYVDSFGLDHLRAVWRLSLGLGVVPALLVFLWRLKMMEPDHFQKNSMKHALIPYRLVIKRYWVRWLAISITWFLYDFIAYPVSSSSRVAQ
jgi:hypothetical protein